jgi:two-component system OmpR family sensor kinase
MSIRWRLTLWYTTILAIIIVVFGALLYSLLTSALTSSIDRQLENAASRVRQSARLRLSYASLKTVLEIPELDVLATPGLYIQVYDSDSGQILRSKTLGEAPLPLEEPHLSAVLNGQSFLETAQVGESRLRIYSAPLTVADQVQGVVQVATPLNQLDQTQNQLIGILIVVGGGAIAIAAGLGALLARVALRPIDVITQTALSISRTEDLSRRLETRGPPDEVGRLASTFNEMLARLEVLFRTQKRFIADVSHELRTPLTIIQGNLDVVCRDAVPDPEARLEMLSDTSAEVARMSRLVADLLLLARTDAGVRLETRPVELDTLLLEVYRQVRHVSRHVEVRLGHEDQAVVMGDADRLRQLLLNLVDNAVKYTPAGGRVTLSLYHDSDWVRIVVADTGLGIPAEDLQEGPSGLPLIFERFYRVDPARSGAGRGTGLGLSIAQWIAQAHGGKITVESQVGKGSTFTTWLPAKENPPA